MKYTPLVILIFSLVMLFIGCTDVPLSYNAVLSSKGLLGHWEDTDSTEVSITYNEMGKVVYKRRYSKKPEDLSEEDHPIYFTNLMIGNKLHQFISIEDIDKTDTTYMNFEFDFLTSGSLVLTPLKEGTFKNEKGEPNAGKFHTTMNFQNYVRTNINKPNFYDRGHVYTKRSRPIVSAAPDDPSIRRRMLQKG